MTELSHGNEPQQAAVIQDEILVILKEVILRRLLAQQRLTQPLSARGAHKSLLNCRQTMHRASTTIYHHFL